jgi:antitoxin component of MazEF toxin-antitoxin module
MNVRMTAEKQITLPNDVVEALQLEPGNEVAFARSASGEITLTKVERREAIETLEQIRERLTRISEEARKNMFPEFAHMTTDEFMSFIRGDDV